jgi:hypothetical protein
VTPRSALGGLALVAMISAGCGDASERPKSDADPTVAATPEADTWSPSTDPYATRDLLVDEVRGAGDVRVTVAGRPSETVVDLSYLPDQQRFARRFSWQQDGTAREVLQIANGRVCANRAAAAALEALGNPGMGYLEASERAYSCTGRGDSTGAFVIYGYAALDVVSRLAGLLGQVTLDDLGPETDEAGVTLRHVRMQATESDRSLRETPTTYDLWVDGDGRLVRAEFSSLDESYGPYVATFGYGEQPDIELPADRGPFVLHAGVGPGPRP